MYTFVPLLLIFLCAANAEWFKINGGGVPDYTTEGNAMPPGRHDAALWCSGDDVYMYGGVDGDGQPLHDLWKYETETRRWFWQPDPPQMATGPRWTANGRNWLLNSQLWSYNPLTRQWNASTGAAPPQASWWLNAQSNSAYVYGKTLRRVDLATRVWSDVAPAGPAPPYPGVATVRQDTAYVFETGDLYAFDKDWAALNDSFPDSRTDPAFWVSPSQDRLMIFGGRIGAEVMGDSWAWKDGRWERDNGRAPGARWGAATCTDADGNTYLFGGVADRPYNDLWKYGTLSRQDILDVLTSSTLSAYVAAVFSILTFVGLVTGGVAWLVARCCRRRRELQYHSKMQPLVEEVDKAFN